MKIIISFLSIQFLALTMLWGQKLMTVQGSLIDEHGEPLFGGNIVIPGTSIGTSSDMNGEFQLEIPADTELLVFSYIGYIPREAAPEENMTIVLQLDTTMMDELVVSVQKPTLLITPEKTTVYPGMSPATSSGNAYSVLKSLPGVILNNDGTLYLNGKSGVKILVDGKDSYFSGADLVNYLIALPAASLNKIDLIHNPSARYEAAGNAGIIDITTSKNSSAGYHININSNFEQGRYNRSNNNIGLGYNNDKWSINGMYGYYKGDDYVDLKIARTFPEDDSTPIIFFDQDSYRKQDNRSHYFNGEIDFYANRQTTLGLSLRGNLGRKTENGRLSSLFYTLVSPADSTISSNTDNRQSRKNINSTLNFRHRLDSIGKEVLVSADGIYYSINETEDHKDLISESSGDAADYRSQQRKRGTIKMISGRVDLAYPFNSRWRMDVGARSDYVDIDSRSDYKKMDGGEWIDDTNRGATFFYKENINAIYMSGQLTEEVLSAEIGMRLENTNINSDAIDRSYTHLFPYLRFSLHLWERTTFTFNYNRRIDRPNYRDLNPFIYVFDSYTYEQGNINLKPQFTDRFSLSYTIGRAYKFGLFYNNTGQAIIKSYNLQPDTKRVIVMPTNFSSFRSLGMEVDAAGVSVADWLHFNFHAEVSDNRYKWLENGVPMENSGVTFQVGAQSRLRLPWGWSAEVIGFYNSRMPFGQIEVKAVYQISAGVQKSFFNGRATLNIFSNDLFHTNRIRARGVISGGYATTDEYSDNVIFGISLSFRLKKGSDMKKNNNKKEIDTKRISL